MTQTQLRHLDIPARHPRPGLCQQLFRVQSNPAHKLERALARVAVDAELLRDRGRERTFADTEQDPLGFGGRGQEQLKKGRELVRDDA